METKPHKEFSFENAYKRLEIILGQLNSGETALEDSLTLFEEANKLITSCSSKLNQAEQKIEMLVKARDGKTEVSPFHSDFDKVLERDDASKA